MFYVITQTGSAARTLNDIAQRLIGGSIVFVEFLVIVLVIGIRNHIDVNFSANCTINP